MKIKWLGHSAFILTSEDNIKIVTDPYSTRSDILYRPINEKADIVTVSHSHDDHNNVSSISGEPVVLTEKGSYAVKGIEIRAIPVFHDENQGQQRGPNLVFCFKIDGLVVCHAGDLGHILSTGQIREVGTVDILLIPVGGYYTVGSKEAKIIVESLNPRLVLPMHYKTKKNKFSYC
jgi:L-ascorbate metabolism protein UlaG (beta-lactamase superfamily)